jgi:hypothetical protein
MAHLHPAAGRKPDRASRLMARPAGAPAGGAGETAREARKMGSVLIRIPLVTWRDGRPRFVAGPAHRALGYRGADLRHPPLDRAGRPVGAWFSLDEAIAWSKARVAEIEARRRAIAAGETTARKQANAIQRARQSSLLTVSQLVEKFLAQPRMRGEERIEGKKKRRALKANTVRYYRSAAAALGRHNAGRVWHEVAANVSAKALTGILDRIEVESGLAVARSVRALLSAAYGFGKALVPANPVRLTETLPALPPRLRCGEPAEMAALVKGCDALGFPDVADAILLGLMSGQRQNDRLALTDAQVTPDGILFRQGKKHGQPLLIPVQDPEWIARLAAARARRRDWRVSYPHVLLDERNRRPWDEHDYRKVFRALRVAIATGALETVAGRNEPTRMAQRLLGHVDIRAKLADAGVELTSSLIDFRDQDLRDTAVTWLARAKCEKFEIAAITGHSLKSIDEILKHYLGLHPELARSAMAKMVAWRAGQGR